MPTSGAKIPIKLVLRTSKQKGLVEAKRLRGVTKMEKGIIAIHCSDFIGLEQIPIDYRELLPKFAKIWPSMGEEFLRELAWSISRRNVGKMQYGDAALWGAKLHNLYDKDPDADGQVAVTTDRNTGLEGSNLWKIRVTITATVGRSLYLEWDNYNKLKWGFIFPTPSTSSSGEVKKILNDVGVEYTCVYEGVPVWERQLKVDRAVRRLFGIANEAKNCGMGYELTNNVFAWLLQRSQDDKKIKLELETGDQHPETPGYYDLLVLQHEQGEELRIPAPLVSEHVKAKAVLRGNRTPLSKPEQEEHEFPEAYGTYYQEACLLVARIQFAEDAKKVFA